MKRQVKLILFLIVNVRIAKIIVLERINSLFMWEIDAKSRL